MNYERLHKAVAKLKHMDINNTLRYGEFDVLVELIEYVTSTYNEHYTNANNAIQGLDVWAARGTLCDTSIDNAIKYQMRYGKKGGYNRKDILKPIHYLVLALAAHDNMSRTVPVKAPPLDFDSRATTSEPVAAFETTRIDIPDNLYINGEK